MRKPAPGGFAAGGPPAFHFRKKSQACIFGCGIIGRQGGTVTDGVARDYKERVLKVLVHLQRRLDEPLALEELARIANFSPYHFHRVFTALVGETVMQHVRRLRMERAVYRLAISDEPVTRIALDAGYDSHEGFTRAFRAMYHVTPSEMRARTRKELRLDAPSSVHYSPDGAVKDFEPLKFGGAPLDVRAETLDPVTVAFMRHLGPYAEVGSAWRKLARWAGERGLFKAESVFMGIAYDIPEITPSDKIRYDACIVIDGDFAPQGDVGRMRLDGGRFALVTHRGPYETVDTTIENATRWLIMKGYDMAPEPLRALYRNFMEKPSPENLITDLAFPLSPGK